TDKLFVRLEAIAEDLKAPTPSPEHKTRLPKVDIRPFDESNPKVWFDQLMQQMRAAKILEEDTQFATLSRFLDGSQALFVSPVLESGNDKPFSMARDLLMNQFSLTKIQKIQQVMFIEKRGSEEKTAHLLSRINPLLENISVDDFRKFVLFSSLPDNVKHHVATDFESCSVVDFQRKCDVLLDVGQNKGTSQVVSAVWNTQKIERNKYKNKGKETKNVKSPRQCTFHLAYGEKSRSCKGPNCPSWNEKLKQMKFTEKTSGNEDGSSTKEPSTPRS
ncbi:Hypothetical predicted protein, partial [Paramuricea clavata]